jgi:rod shape-determining protein MreD
MRQIPLIFPFSIACFFALFESALFSSVKLFAFSPFLAFLYNRSNFQTSLWIASLCGLLIDLFSSEFRFGTHALGLCLTTLLLYRQKKHFFEDKPIALCLFALLIAATSSLLQLLLISIFDRALPFSMGLLATDLVLMPLVDASYAFVCFCCPMLLYLHIKKIGWKVFVAKLLNKNAPADGG